MIHGLSRREGCVTLRELTLTHIASAGTTSSESAVLERGQLRLDEFLGNIRSMVPYLPPVSSAVQVVVKTDTVLHPI